MAQRKPVRSHPWAQSAACTGHRNSHPPSPPSMTCPPRKQSALPAPTTRVSPSGLSSNGRRRGRTSND